MVWLVVDCVDVDAFVVGRVGYDIDAVGYERCVEVWNV